MLVLNRSAIVVKPKEPFLDWLHAADPSGRDLTLLDLVREPTIYLIPECDTDDDVVHKEPVAAHANRHQQEKPKRCNQLNLATATRHLRLVNIGFFCQGRRERHYPWGFHHAHLFPWPGHCPRGINQSAERDHYDQQSLSNRPREKKHHPMQPPLVSPQTHAESSPGPAATERTDR
jgi:hypothetical protein